MKPQSRKHLQTELINGDAHPEAPDVAAARPIRPMSSFDSSMALTLVFLLTVLLFLGFFSIYIPCFSRQASAEISRRRRHHAHQRAASKARALPLFLYGAAGEGGDRDRDRPMECTICLAEFEERETVRMIPYCGHLFHQQCIDAWFFYSKASCPLCRSTQLFKGSCSSSSSSSSSSSLVVEGGGSRGVGSTVGEAGLSGLRRASSCSSSSFSGREVLLSLHRSSSF